MIKQIKKWGCLLALLFILGSCNFEEIQLKGTDNLKLESITGRNISITFDVILNNPNKHTFKIKPAVFDLYINGNKVGLAHLNETLIIYKKAELPIKTPVTLELAEGSLATLLLGLIRKTASVRIVGKVKGSVSGFSKTKEIDETREIPLKQLGLDLLF